MRQPRQLWAGQAIPKPPKPLSNVFISDSPGSVDPIFSTHQLGADTGCEDDQRITKGHDGSVCVEAQGNDHRIWAIDHGRVLAGPWKPGGLGGTASPSLSLDAPRVSVGVPVKEQGSGVFSAACARGRSLMCGRCESEKRLLKP